MMRIPCWSLVLAAGLAACEPATPPAAAPSAAQPAPVAPLAAAATAAVSYRSELAFADLDFEIETLGEGEQRQLQIRTRRGGAEAGRHQQALEGRLREVRAADLDANGQPELLLVVEGAEAASDFFALAWRDGVFLEQRLPEPTVEQLEGAAGLDAYALLADQVHRQIPLEDGQLRELRYRYQADRGFYADGAVERAAAPG